MKKIAIYPGTFDPITYGHIDVIQKSLKIVDKIIVGISDSNQKKYLFSIDERMEIVRKALFFDLKFNKNKIKVKKIINLGVSFSIFNHNLGKVIEKFIECLKNLDHLAKIGIHLRHHWLEYQIQNV